MSVEHREIASVLEQITVRLKTVDGVERGPSALSLSWSIPQHDIHYRWHSSLRGCGCLPADWGGGLVSSLSQHLPLLVLMGVDGENRLAVSCSEALERVVMKAGICEETCHVSCSVELFAQAVAPLSTYEVTLRFDSRHEIFSEIVSDLSQWQLSLRNETLPAVPEAAFKPFYSTWYSYHHHVFAEELERECTLAAQYGMGGIIIDGGWYADDGKRGCDYWGDGEVSAMRFPDMRRHVANIHALGMKYVMWFGIPFIGYHSQAYERFRGKFLNDQPGLDCSSLDPRFPDVRDYLIATYEHALQAWDIDGFKFDFIDMFSWRGEDPALADNFAGRDIRSVPAAVDELLSTACRRLRQLKPDLLIEFRQPYVGPAIRKYANMFRVVDCPGDAFTNRIGIANLRLSNRPAAVHSDMLEWHSDCSVEDAARQVLAVMFGVPQVSVRLGELPEAHRQMLAYHLRFMSEHREVLLHSMFQPLYPEQNYPLIWAHGVVESIGVLYGCGQVVELPVCAPRCQVFNATGLEMLYVSSGTLRQGRVVDCLGNDVGEVSLDAGLARVNVPLSGSLVIE